IPPSARKVLLFGNKMICGRSGPSQGFLAAFISGRTEDDLGANAFRLEGCAVRFSSRVRNIGVTSCRLCNRPPESWADTPNRPTELNEFFAVLAQSGDGWPSLHHRGRPCRQLLGELVPGTRAAFRCGIS